MVDRKNNLPSNKKGSNMEHTDTVFRRARLIASGVIVPHPMLRMQYEDSVITLEDGRTVQTCQFVGPSQFQPWNSDKPCLRMTAVDCLDAAFDIFTGNEGPEEISSAGRFWGSLGKALAESGHKRQNNALEDHNETEDYEHG